MSNISVSGIEGTASEIQGVNDILKNTATKTSTSSDRISKLATEFASYNNQVVAENTPHTIGLKSVNSIDYYEEYDTWVTTTGGLESRASSLASKAEEINSVVDRITTKVADIQTIATAIQGYIDTVQGILENNSIAASISATALSSAFLALGRDGVAKANLATSGSDINSRNFLDYDSIKDDEKLNGGLLSFEKQDDGSYLIKKDGESTGYYTTGLAAGLYMKTLTTTVGNEYKAFSSAASKFYDSTDTIGSNKENLNSDKIDLKEEQIRIHKANESTNKNSDNYSDSKIDLSKDDVTFSESERAGDEMVQKYHEQQTKSTKNTTNSAKSLIDELEKKEQYTYNGEMLNNQTTKVYKGKSGGYKITEELSEGDSRVTYYDKNNDYIYSAILNENGDLLMADGD